MLAEPSVLDQLRAGVCDGTIGIRAWQPSDLTRLPLILTEETRASAEIPDSPFVGEEWLRRQIDVSLGTVYLSLAITDPSGLAIGGLELSQHEAFGNTFIGYWVGPAHRRQGAASRAVQLALSLLPTPDLNLLAICKPHNRGSIKVLERCGFRQLGPAPRGLVFGYAGPVTAEPAFGR